jgi:hypothetical protein
VLQLSGDPAGGAVALVETASESGPVRTIRTYSSAGVSLDISQTSSVGFAIHPDGPLYAVSAASGQLIGTDIGLGRGYIAAFPATTSAQGIPTVLADGRVAVPFVTGLAPLDVALHVLFLRPDGTTVVQEVADPEPTDRDTREPGVEWIRQVSREQCPHEYASLDAALVQQARDFVVAP